MITDSIIALLTLVFKFARVIDQGLSHVPLFSRMSGFLGLIVGTFLVAVLATVLIRMAVGPRK